MQKFFILLPILAALFVLASPIAAAPGDLDSGFGSERIVTVDKDGICGKTIPFAQLGTEAQKQYLGDGIAILPTQDGAMLRAAFQKLEGMATSEGLWLNSTAGAEDAAKADRFRVVAAEVGRQEGGVDTVVRLPSTGTIKATREVATFIRPGLIEEYTVSMNGVRQDFVVKDRPAGKGEMCVTLEVNGAQVAAASYGAKLTLAASGREIAYSRLHVTDADGRVLKARFVVIGTSRLSVRVDDAGASYPVRIDPTFSDADWNPLGTGVNGSVYCIAVLGNDVYVGGTFTAASGVSTKNIAKWNGANWSALSTGTNSFVAALAVIGPDLYAGGAFTQAGGLSVNNIAKWNGTNWSALSTGTNSHVYALASSGSNLYAGGVFTQAGGLSANGIAKWNGINWSAMSTGMTGNVFALAVVADWEIYAGGGFSIAGSVSANNVAKWNGTAWSALGIGTDSTVNALVVSGADLYAGGSFTTAGGTSANNVAKWKSGTWSALSTGTSNVVSTLAVSGPDLYVGGSFATAGGVNANNIAKWDGTAWSALGTGTTGGVQALAVSGSVLYAGGWFSAAGGKSAPNIARANITLTVPANQPQKVVFCYGHEGPYRLVADEVIISAVCSAGASSGLCGGSDHHVEEGGMGFTDVPDGTGGSRNLQEEYFQAVKKVFQDNGVITGMIFSKGPPEADAINVYFIPQIPTFLALQGISATKEIGGLPDRFNRFPRGDVQIVFGVGNEANRVQTIVHEIGHCLGLFHIDPKNISAPTNLLGGLQNPSLAWHACIMDYLDPDAFNPPPLTTPMSFFPEAAWCADPAAHTKFDFGNTFGGAEVYFSSNELYYLLRYVEKIDPTLVGILPGTYDLETSYLPRFNGYETVFSMATSQTLYKVKVLQESMMGQPTLVAEYPSLTPSQWSTLQLKLNNGSKITMVASTSSTSPEADVILVAAPNGQPLNASVPVSGTVPLQMLQLTGTSTFTTIGVGEIQGTPLATTSAASAVTSGWATLNGEVILSGSTGTAWFEYGTTDTYGRKTYDSSIPSGTGSTSVSFNIGGLLKGTTYHYRLMVTNADGIVYGADQTFTTPSVTSPPAWHSAQLTTVSNAADGNRTGAAHSSWWFYYYKGTDSNIWRTSWTGTQWEQAQLTSDGNVDDWLSFGTGYNVLCYKGKDNRLWELYWSGTEWVKVALGTNANVAGDVVMDNGWNLIFYRGTDQRVWKIWWDGTKWAQEALGGAANVQGSLAVDGPYHLVYYRGADNHLWCYYWGGVQWVQLRLSTTANVGGSVAADAGGGLAYYRSLADNSAWELYWNGSAWNQVQLDPLADINPARPIEARAAQYYSTVYLNNNGQCAAEFWNGAAWNNVLLGDGGWGLTGGLSLHPATHWAFARRSDGHLIIFYYQ